MAKWNGIDSSPHPQRKLTFHGKLASPLYSPSWPTGYYVSNSELAELALFLFSPNGLEPTFQRIERLALVMLQMSL